MSSSASCIRNTCKSPRLSSEATALQIKQPAAEVPSTEIYLDWAWTASTTWPCPSRTPVSTPSHPSRVRGPVLTFNLMHTMGHAKYALLRLTSLMTSLVLLFCVFSPPTGPEIGACGFAKQSGISSNQHEAGDLHPISFLPPNRPAKPDGMGSIRTPVTVLNGYTASLHLSPAVWPGGTLPLLWSIQIDLDHSLNRSGFP